MLVVVVVVAGEVDVLGEVEIAVLVTVEDELLAGGTLDEALEEALEEVVTCSDEPVLDGTGATVTGSLEVGTDESDC